jgi:hypothetical protein
VHVDKRHLDRAIVTLRVEGNVPLSGIQRSLEEILGTHRSIGYLSGVITQAQAQAGAFLSRVDYQRSGTGLLDEVFAHRTPILGVVEPTSTAVLGLFREEARDADTWGVHLLDLEAQGFHFTGVASDEARGLVSGVQQALGASTLHQADWGHLFGKVARLDAQLERKAYAAIRAEEERFRVLDSAKSESVIQARIEAWEQAHQTTQEALGLYDDFHYLAEEFYGLFLPVGAEGTPRSLEALTQDLDALRSLLSTLPGEKGQELAIRLGDSQARLFAFFEDWQGRLEELSRAIPPDALRHVLLGEYFLARRKPTPATQSALRHATAQVEHLAGEQALPLRKLVAQHLDSLVRTSSLVETTNSWLRPYLFLRKGTSQGFLDLVGLYHNSRPYRRGKRQGHSPFELVGLELEDDDWLSRIGLPRS